MHGAISGWHADEAVESDEVRVVILEVFFAA